MQSISLSAKASHFDVQIELDFGERVARLSSFSGAVRVQRTIDVGPLLAAGLSAHDALDFTLRAVCVGVESGSLHDF